MKAVMTRAVILVAAVIVLVAVNGSILAKERLKSHGQRIYLELGSVDPRSLMQTEPLRAEYQDRDRRLAVMDEQGLDAALLFPTLGCGVEEALRDDVPATMASMPRTI